MLPPETSTTHSRLPAVPRRRRSAALRSRSSCLETSGSRLAQDPDCTADDQTPPIQNDPRALECDWLCAGRRHEKTKPWNSIFPDACFESLFLTFSMFHNVSQSLLLNHVTGNPPEAHTPCPQKTVAMIFLADKVSKHFLGLLGELMCPHSIDCFLVSQVACFTQVSSPVTTRSRSESPSFS